METIGYVLSVITAMAVAYQKLTEAIVKKLKGRAKELIDPVYLCFLLSFFTCLFWQLGILSLFKTTPPVFDALVTALIMSFEAGILNDLAGIAQSKKQLLQQNTN